jgi:hypothetical protein
MILWVVVKILILFGIRAESHALALEQADVTHARAEKDTERSRKWLKMQKTMDKNCQQTTREIET